MEGKNSGPARPSVADYLRSVSVDNFIVEGRDVRVGSRWWTAVECRCGLIGCNGWELIPKAAPGSSLKRRPATPA